MPVLFLGLVLDRAGERQLAIHFRSCDYIRSGKRRSGHLDAIRPVVNQIKSLTIHIMASSYRLERDHLPDLFVVPHQNLKSLDLSFNAFHASSSRRNRQYQPDIGDTKETVIPQLIALIPTHQLKHLTLRHMKGWPATRFGNLTSLTLFGFVDGRALAEAVPANPSLRKLKLESVWWKRHSYDPKRLVDLDGQTLELASCESGVLDMFALSSTCALIITRTMEVQENALAFRGLYPSLDLLPNDISAVQCLRDVEEVHFSVTKTPGRKGWITVEQRTVGYPKLKSSPGAELKPSLIFVLTYHYHTEESFSGAPFTSQYLLPHPSPWIEITRASFDDFRGDFRICDDGILNTLPSLRSIALRRCNSRCLVRLITPSRLRGLESLWFVDELSGAGSGDDEASEISFEDEGMDPEDEEMDPEGKEMNPEDEDLDPDYEDDGMDLDSEEGSSEGSPKDELFVEEFGNALTKMVKLRHQSAGLRLKELKIVTSGDPGSTITVEQMGKLKECVDRVEIAKAPGYRCVAI